MSIVCRPQIVIPMMPGPPAQCRPAAPAGHHFASAQVSSRTRTSQPLLCLRTSVTVLYQDIGDSRVVVRPRPPREVVGSGPWVET